MKNIYLLIIFMVLFSCKSENVNDNLTQFDKALDLSIQNVKETLDKPAYYYRISQKSASQINKITNLSDSLLKLIDSNSLKNNSVKYNELKNLLISFTPCVNNKKLITEILKVPFSRDNLLLEEIKIKQSLFLYLDAYQDSIESRSIDIYDIKTMVLTEKTKFEGKNSLNVKVLPIAANATIYVGEYDSVMNESGKFVHYMLGDDYDSVAVEGGIGKFGYTIYDKQVELKGLIRFRTYNGESITRPYNKILKY